MDSQRALPCHASRRLHEETQNRVAMMYNPRSGRLCLWMAGILVQKVSAATQIAIKRSDAKTHLPHGLLSWHSLEKTLGQAVLMGRCDARSCLHILQPAATCHCTVHGPQLHVAPIQMHTLHGCLRSSAVNSKHSTTSTAMVASI